MEEKNIIVDELQENITKLKTFINNKRTDKNCYTGTGISHMFSGKKPCDQHIVNAKKTLVAAIAALQSLKHIDDTSDAVDLTHIDLADYTAELVSNCQNLNMRIKEILNPKIVSGVNPMIATAEHQRNGGKRSRRYNKKSKKTMRRRRGRTYRKK